MRRLPCTFAALTVACATLATPACMLITSPGSFTIVADAGDGSTHADTGSREAGAGDTGSRDSGSGDASGACSSIATTSCGDCVAASCCASYVACSNSPACVALSNCDPGDTACENDNTGGMELETSYANCASESCPVCFVAGVGDPCGDGVMCDTNLSCTTGWCTKLCQTDSDCAGADTNGENSTGGQNRCAENPLDPGGQPICFPGCNGPSDCTMYSGTSCFEVSAVGGGTTNVCVLIADGGVPDASAPESGIDAPVDSGTFDAGSDASGVSEGGF